MRNQSESAAAQQQCSASDVSDRTSSAGYAHQAEPNVPSTSHRWLGIQYIDNDHNDVNVIDAIVGLVVVQLSASDRWHWEYWSRSANGRFCSGRCCCRQRFSKRSYHCISDPDIVIDGTPFDNSHCRNDDELIDNSTDRCVYFAATRHRIARAMHEHRRQ